MAPADGELDIVILGSACGFGIGSVVPSLAVDAAAAADYCRVALRAVLYARRATMCQMLSYCTAPRLHLSNDWARIDTEAQVTPTNLPSRLKRDEPPKAISRAPSARRASNVGGDSSPSSRRRRLRVFGSFFACVQGIGVPSFQIHEAKIHETNSHL